MLTRNYTRDLLRKISDDINIMTFIHSYSSLSLNTIAI